MANLEVSPRYKEISGPQEACGITAIFSKTGESVSNEDPSLQGKLQHRGTDSAGMATWNNGNINTFVGLGKVVKVFPPNFDYSGHNLLSDRAIGHNRYGTSGGDKKDDDQGAQPTIAEWGNRKIAIAYNGNIPDILREKLKSRLPTKIKDGIFDTQDIANAIVSALGGSWEEKIKNALEGIPMAYSLTILTDDGRVFGLRGPSGTWPLWYGETDNKIIFASETRVYDKENIKWREVKPGELVEATPTGVIKKRIFEETKRVFRCGLHDTYGAKEDSLMTEEGFTHGDFRRELGRQLAKEYVTDADIIVGVPNTSLIIADEYATELNRTSTILIEKKEENGEKSEVRGFIAPNVDETSRIVNAKYKIPNPDLAKEKKVLLIDDSLIRGLTMGGDPKKNLKGVIGFVRDAGAKEVHLAVVLPKFVNGCDMGYFIKKDQLVALAKNDNGEYVERSEQEIADIIGANSVHFLSIDGVRRAYEKTIGKKEVACMACMGGLHPLEAMKRPPEKVGALVS